MRDESSDRRTKIKEHQGSTKGYLFINRNSSVGTHTGHASAMFGRNLITELCISRRREDSQSDYAEC